MCWSKSRKASRKKWVSKNSARIEKESKLSEIAALTLSSNTFQYKSGTRFSSPIIIGAPWFSKQQNKPTAQRFSKFSDLSSHIY